MGCVHSSFDYRWPSAVVPFDLSRAPRLDPKIRVAFNTIEKVTPFRFVDIRGRPPLTGFLSFTETEADDPLPGTPLVSGNWKSIRGEHRLTRLADNLIVDWIPDAAAVRVWNVDLTKRGPSIEAPLGTDDPFVEPAAFDDKWPSGVAGNQLVTLGGDRILTVGSSGHYRVWQFLRHGRSVSIDPHVVASGQLDAPVFVKGTKLIGVNDRFVLSFLPDDGSHRLFLYDAAARGAAPILTALTNQRQWKSIGVGHELVSLGGSRVLDIQLSTQYRIFAFNSGAVGNDDPLEGAPVAKGAWPSTVLNEMVSLDNDHVLAYRPADGEYRVWIYQRNASYSDSIGRAPFF